MASINLDIGGNTARLDRDIQQTVNKVYSINLKTKGEQPLGRITGQVNEFNKSLDASNARVIAFGASAGVIYGVQRAFDALVSSTIDVQKSLQDINVILNASKDELNKFGSELFNIAKNTGQSFDNVAKAATEFSRQGLGISETLKRTNEALILSRLSGLDAAKSVEALTAAVNSFASQAVTATQVVNKFANVDAAFAVSSSDLAEAISRVGSSAVQSGVNLDELIAIVTSAQQTTARGGAVIGNAFKTIFTRLQRGKVVDLLESLGVSSTDSSGQLKSTIQLLQDLAGVYDKLGSTQQAAVAEKVGGVFQINILKAALADLGKQYSVYSSALQISASSTDQAIKRNDQLNKTYAAQLNTLQQNATQLAAMAGQKIIGPSFDRIVGSANTFLGGINNADTNSYGAILGKGILDGLGQFIAGPGLALIGGVLLKLFKNLGTFATGSFKELLGLNKAASQQQSLQQSISQILAKNPQLIELALKGEQGLNLAANTLLANLQKQTLELQKQAQVASQISKAFYGAGVRVSGGIPVTPTKTVKAAGYVPNFVSDGSIEKAQAMALGATPSVRPHMSQGTIGGRKFVMNNQETEYPGVGSNGDSMVIPHYAARGFIPNFAQNSIRGYSVFDGDSLKVDTDYPNKKLQGKELRLESVDAIESWQKYGKTGSPDNAESLAKSIIYREFPNLDSVLKSSGKTGSAAYDRPYFFNKNLQEQLIEKGLGVPDLRYGSSFNSLTMGVMNRKPGIGLWSDKNKDGFYNHAKAQQFIKQNNLEKKLSSQKGLPQYKKNFILGTASNWGNGRYKGGELLPDKYKDKGKPGSKTYKPGKSYNYEAMNASGFIPNFAPIPRSFLEDLRKWNRQYLSNDIKKTGNFNERGELNTYRGYKTKTPQEAKKLSSSKIFAPRSIRDLEEAKNSFLNRGVKNSLQDHRFLTTPVSQRPFVSSSSSKEVAESFSKQPGFSNQGVVGTTGINLSRIVNNKTLTMLNEKYGAMRTHEYLLRLTKMGGGRGMAFDMNSLLKEPKGSAFANEKELALAASGFIPNFATTGTGSVIDLGDIAAGSPILKGKVASLIHPGESSGIQKVPVKSTYRGQAFKGLLPTAGINKGQLKQGINIPNVVDDVEQMLLNQANNFGQVLGSSGLPMTPLGKGELPNTGAVKGAAGVAFEGGVKSVVQKSLQATTQNANIDFAKPSSKLKNIFNKAPGVYDAKYTPALADDVLTKLLRYAQPAVSGVTKPVTSGPGYKDYQAKRQSALDEIRKSGVSGSVEIKRALKEKGFARGFIPNFSSTNRGVPISQIRAHFDKSGSPVAVTNTRDEPNGLKDAIGRERKGIGMYAGGFVPNFVDSGNSSSISTTILSLGTELGALTFYLRGSRAEYQNSLEELTGINIKSAKQALVSAEKQLQASTITLNAYKQNEIAAKAFLEQSKVGGVRNQPGSILAAQEARRGTRNAREKFTNTGNETLTARGEVIKAKGGLAGRTKAFGSAYGGAASIAAPILAETAKNFLPKEGKTGRVASAGVDVVSQMVSMGSMGAMFGPVGAAAGVAAGALMTVPKLLEEWNTDFPELSAAAQKSSEELSKFRDFTQALGTVTQNLHDALAGEIPDAKKLKAAREAYAAVLETASQEDRNRIKNAVKGGGDAMAVAQKIQQEKERNSDMQQKNAAFAEFAGKLNNDKYMINGDSQSDKAAREQASLVTKNMISSNILQGKTGTDAEKITTSLTKSGENGQESIALRFAKLSQKSSNADFSKEGKNLSVRGRQNIEQKSLGELLPEFQKILQEAIPDSNPQKQTIIEQNTKDAEGSLKNLIGLTSEWSSGLFDLAMAGKDSAQITREQEAAEIRITALAKREASFKKSAIETTNQMINALQRNISAAQQSIEAERARQEVFTKFNSEQSFADQFERPRQAATAIVGENAPLAQKLTLREDAQNIMKTLGDGITSTNKSLIDSLTTVLNENFNEATQVKAPDTETAKGQDITAYNTKVLGPLTGNIKSAFYNIQGILDKNLISGSAKDAGQQEIIMGQIKDELIKAGLDEKTRDKILLQSKEEFKKGAINIEKLKAESIVAFKTLAKEQTQKILLQKIGQSLSFGGGIENFLKPPDASGEDTSALGQVRKAVQGFDQFNSTNLKDRRFDYNNRTNQFKYQNPESVKARQEMAPERGRSALELIGGLQNMLPGYTPETKGKAYEAGVTGLTQFYTNTITELKKIAGDKNTDTLVRETITSALAQTKDITPDKAAKLQIAQRTGALDETQFKGIMGSFKDPVLDKFKEQISSMGNKPVQDILMKELDDIGKNALVSQDPTVNAINKSNEYLSGILETIGGRTSEQKFEDKINATMSGQKLPTKEGVVNNETVNNTSALSSEALIKSINTLVESVNRVVSPQSTQMGGQQTTTNAPVNVVVNAQGSNDIAKAVGDAVQNAIPTIIDKVKVALGQKVPPKSTA